MHSKGTIKGGCGNTGGHFNPYATVHAGPTEAVRHVGDLGNIIADKDGKVDTVIIDDRITLYEDQAEKDGKKRANVVGLAFVIHSGKDDMGKGTGLKAAGSKASGNAGTRVACGTIKMLS